MPFVLGVRAVGEASTKLESRSCKALKSRIQVGVTFVVLRPVEEDQRHEDQRHE